MNIEELKQGEIYFFDDQFKWAIFQLGKDIHLSCGRIYTMRYTRAIFKYHKSYNQGFAYLTNDFILANLKYLHPATEEQIEYLEKCTNINNYNNKNHD